MNEPVATAAPLPLIYIEWEDSVSVNSGWNRADEIREWADEEPYLVHQAGYLIVETDTYLVLASQYNPCRGGEPKFSSLHKVPKSWLRRRVELHP